MEIMDGWYSIRQVSEMTHLSTQLIRKWEDRYQTIHPRRLQNGYRVYSEHDVQTLLRVKELVDEGYSVKNAMLLIQQRPEDEGRKHEAKNETASVQAPHNPSEDEAHTVIQQLLALGERSDDQQITAVLHRTLHRFGTVFLVHSVILPFLIQVGEHWESGTWSESQEHIASLAIRDYLVRLRNTISEPPAGPLMLGACLPMERHEIPVHVVLLEASLRGWRTAFLGASPAWGAIEDAVSRLHPQVVILSASTLQPFETHPDALYRLDEFAREHPHVQMLAGGAGVMLQVKQTPVYHMRIVSSVEELGRHLAKWDDGLSV